MKNYWILFLALFIIDCALHSQVLFDANDLNRAAEYSRDKGGSAVLEEMFQSDGTNPGHGKFLWLNARNEYGTSQEMKAPAGSSGGFIYHYCYTEMIGAHGAGKNRMYMIPSLNAVILRQTPNENDTFDHHAFLSLLLGGSTCFKRRLVAHWTFDHDSTDMIMDESGNGFHGRGYQLSYGRGIIGEAALFDGTQAEIHIPGRGEKPSAAIATMTQGTISLWFKYQSVGGAVLPLFYFGEGDRGTPHNSLIIEIGHRDNPGNRKLYFTIINRSFCFDSGEALEENRWYHFAAVVSDNGNTGYLNGQLMTQRHYNLGSDSTFSEFFADVPVQECLAIGYGRYGLSDEFFHFKGAIDDVRLYDAPLSGEEVRTLYEEGTLPQDKPLPTYSDVPYGPYERNVLDFWQAPSAEPTPLVVFIHGGGFVSGDKSSASAGDINYCLQHGVSFAAINYRLRSITRLDTIMLDCARALQFLRSQSLAWNIDKTRVAAYGGSAGGGASIWLGFHDDLADSTNSDPVLRESTRLTVVGHNNSQATYDCEKWAAIVGVAENWRETMGFVDDLEFLGIDDRSQINDPEIVALRQSLDMPLMMDEHDPPVFLFNLRPDTPPLVQGDVIHHPRHAKYLKARCDSLGIEAVLITAETPHEQRLKMMDFFCAHFFPPSGVDLATPGPIQFTLQQNRPNPFNQETVISYQISVFSHVTLKVYDVLGREVATLVDEYKMPGDYSIRFSLKDNEHASGLLFYQLKTDNHTETKKMIVLK